MWAFFISGIGRWIAAGVIAVLAIGGLYVKGRIDGNVACVAKQQAEMAAMEKYVKGVRERIERRLDPADVDAIMRPDTFQRQP